MQFPIYLSIYFPRYEIKRRKQRNRLRILEFLPKIFRKGGKIVKELGRLLRESVVVQGIITTCFVGTACYLWAIGRPVPDQLWTGCTIVLGFFFGSKIQNIVNTQKAKGR